MSMGSVFVGAEVEGAVNSSRSNSSRSSLEVMVVGAFDGDSGGVKIEGQFFFFDSRVNIAGIATPKQGSFVGGNGDWPSNQIE